MTEMENYFKDLQEQILNKELWDKNRFYVYDHEAGSGKSGNTHKYLGELSKTQSYPVLYVQRFSKDEKLVETVNKINEYAGGRVAELFTGEEAKKTEKRKIAKETLILTITHKMYIQFCKGNKNSVPVLETFTLI